MKPLPNIPEAVVPGTRFGIEVLKAAFALFFLISLIDSIPGLRSVRSEHFRFAVNYGLLSHFLSLGYAVLFAVGLYGIHRRARLAWKLGWLYLALFYLSSIVQAIRASAATRPSSDRWIVVLIVFVGISAVAIYWGNWWNKQKAYFRA